jgi:molybdopterin-guanine dinucleotide biosynthesis protein A
VKLAGRALVFHILETTMEVADEVVVAVGREGRTASYSRIVPEPARVFKDRTRERSLLVGIATDFQAIKSEYSLVLSCDTPFAKRTVLKFLSRKQIGQM